MPRYRFTKTFRHKVDDIQTRSFVTGSIHDDLDAAIVAKAMKEKAIEVIGASSPPAVKPAPKPPAAVGTGQAKAPAPVGTGQPKAQE